MNMPIISLTVDGMRHTINMALTEYQAQMDVDIQSAIDAYCTPENIGKVIRETTQRTLDAVIKEEVERFFRYGDGRKVIAESVKQSILKNETYTALDVCRKENY